MRVAVLFAAAALLAVPSLAEEGESVGTPWYAGASASMIFPQGGTRLERRTGATIRFGRYVTDAVAVEGGASWLEDKAGLAVRGLFHWRAWDEYDKLFGFSRFDPFFTAGAQGWLDRGNVGPSVGVGALWYLDDRWALRFDGDATLGVEAEVAMCYSVSVGLQIAF